MPDNRPLRACMLAMVLLNLAFVQLTGVAGMHWLVPLYTLTLAAPLLERFREKLVYRVLWNGGVLCFFLVLLQHALGAELAYVLEDGLVLAVLCQVHLLNNLRSSQRPDLLFFNAFLIAVITGFLNRGLGFPLAFLVFIPCFVIGLQLLNATRGGRSLPQHVTRRLALDGARRAVLLLGLSVLAFLFWPRDFERKAMFRGTFQSTAGAAQSFELGFNKELKLDRKGTVATSQRLALQVTLAAGKASSVPLLWRGATLGATRAGAWKPLSWKANRGPSSDRPWLGQRGRLVRTPPSELDAAYVEVVRFEQETERLFAPLGAHDLALTDDNERLRLRAGRDGTVEVAETGDVRYALTLARPSSVERSGAKRDRVPAELEPYVELPPRDLAGPGRQLAADLAGQLPADAEQHELVTRFRDHLAGTYVYVAPGSDDAASSLDEFLRGDAGGHCEFFASALATMLRTQGVPCRVVTGYRSPGWDGEASEQRVLRFRMLDAHAWVEVHDPSAGWYAVDPSPALVQASGGTSLLAQLRSAVRSGWATVTGFDAERRAAFFAWVRALPARAVAGYRQHPISGALGLLALFPVCFWWTRRRRARTPEAIRSYRNALRRAKLRLLPGETPRELLARASRQGLGPADLEALTGATREHETARYA